MGRTVLPRRFNGGPRFREFANAEAFRELGDVAALAIFERHAGITDYVIRPELLHKTSRLGRGAVGDDSLEPMVVTGTRSGSALTADDHPMKFLVICPAAL